MLSEAQRKESDNMISVTEFLIFLTGPSFVICYLLIVRHFINKSRQ